MTPTLRVLAAALLLSASTLVLAHGDDDGTTMDMNMGHGESVVPAPIEDAPMSYFRYPEYSGLIMGHIALMTIGWIFVLPLAVVFTVVRSRFSVPMHFAFVVLNVFGVLLSTIYNSNTPDLYPNNAHHKLGWILTWVVGVQAVVALIDAYAERASARIPRDRVAFIPISTEAMEEHHRFHHDAGSDYRFSHDSGHGTERNTESLRTNSISSNGEDRLESAECQRFVDVPDVDDEDEKPRVPGSRRIDRFFARKLGGAVPSNILRVLQAYFHTVNRLILILGFIALLTGAVTYGGIFRARAIFSGLAHFIKGGIFFWYGIFTLGRWGGCFADLGWAWNVKPSQSLVGKRKANAPTAEFVESFLIFFYGASNMFLEHLGGWGKAWSHQDLEHVSISVMFFGGGLCGMFVESTRIRNLLNATFSRGATGSMHDYAQGVPENESFAEPKTYGFSMNPLPALIVILLGMMMGGHEQSSMVSTMIHKQWGDLLAAAAIMRGVTYGIMYLSPPKSLLPTRPPSELVTAFCLIAGGLIFMASSVDTVKAMESNEIDAMFVFNVTMGMVSFLMAYIVGVIALKGWAFRREHKEAFTFTTAA